MKVFIVKNNFTDKKTKNKYTVDDVYNSEIADNERIKELSTEQNDLKKQLIEEKELTELSINQLVQYAIIKKIDIRDLLLKIINKDEIESDESIKSDESNPKNLDSNNNFQKKQKNKNK